LIDFFVDVLKTALGVVLGTVVSMVITGLMLKYFVIDKAMEHKKVKRLQKSFDKAIDKLEEFLEVQKKNGHP
jgi:mannitol-specific phosphotransferase system IIBC component